MSGRFRRLRALWQTQRRRRPVATARVEAAALAIHGRSELVRTVRDLRARVGELERDQRLLAAHVATLTGTAEPAAGPTADGLARARLAAIAMYEERLGALEERAPGRRRARSTTGLPTIGRTADEQRGPR